MLRRSAASASCRFASPSLPSLQRRWLAAWCLPPPVCPGWDGTLRRLMDGGSWQSPFFYDTVYAIVVLLVSDGMLKFFAGGLFSLVNTIKYAIFDAARFVLLRSHPCLRESKRWLQTAAYCSDVRCPKGWCVAQLCNQSSEQYRNEACFSCSCGRTGLRANVLHQPPHLLHRTAP